MTNGEHIDLLKSNLIELASAVARGDVSGIHCIKAYRLGAGVSLKDAKDWYDRMKPQEAPPTTLDIVQRVDRLEAAVLELNPGLNWSR